MKKMYYAAMSIPFFVSLLFHVLADNSFLRFWLLYDAFIVPLYLIMVSAIIYKIRLTLKHFILPITINGLCILSHMYYFKFEFGNISKLIWMFVALAACIVYLLCAACLVIVNKLAKNKVMKSDLTDMDESCNRHT